MFGERFLGRKAEDGKREENKVDLSKRKFVKTGAQAVVGAVLMEAAVSKEADAQSGLKAARKVINKEEAEQHPQRPRDVDGPTTQDQEARPKRPREGLRQEVRSEQIQVEVGGVGNASVDIRDRVQGVIAALAERTGRQVLAGVAPLRLNFGGISVKESKSQLKRDAEIGLGNEAERQANNANIYTGSPALDSLIRAGTRAIGGLGKKGAGKLTGDPEGKLTLAYTAEYGRNLTPSAQRTAVLSYKQRAAKGEQPKYEVFAINDGGAVIELRQTVLLQGDAKDAAASLLVKTAVEQSRVNPTSAYGLGRIFGDYAAVATGLYSSYDIPPADKVTSRPKN